VKLSLCLPIITGLLLLGSVWPQDKPASADPPSAAATVPSPSLSPTPSPSPYKPTELQALRLENLQLRAVSSQKDWTIEAMRLPSYTKFNADVNLLSQECAKVIAENKWPKDVGCDINKSPVEFVKQVQAAAQAQAPVQAQPQPQPKAKTNDDKK